MRAGAGVDNIAVEALRQQGSVVANAAGANAVAVAELTMAHLLNLDRRLSDQVESLRAGEWKRLEFAKGARGLFGAPLAVLGLGNIGCEVAARARAFGMQVRGYDPFVSKERMEELGIAKCETLEEAADGAYALTVHMPLTPETRNAVGEKILGLMLPGALVVNMSRGGVVDEAALLRLAKERGLRAGLDVFENEPGASGTTFEDVAIRECAQVYGTHHTGARTEQAAEAVENAVVRVVEAYLRGEAVPGAVS